MIVMIRNCILILLLLYAPTTCSGSSATTTTTTYFDSEWNGLRIYERITNSYGVPQRIYDDSYPKETRIILDQMEDYMKDIIRLNNVVTTNCKNEDEMCTYWAARGECLNNSVWMSNHCGPSCRTCHTRATDTTYDNNNNEIRAIEWGESQTIDNDYKEKIQTLLNEMNDYMIDEVYIEEKYSSVKDTCKVMNTMCSKWAAQGECENNPLFMRITCAPICKTCELIDYNTRCPIRDDRPIAWPNKDDLNTFFERIISDPTYEQYTPSIISRPNSNNNDNDVPWILQFDTFVTKEECETLIKYGTTIGYQHSVTTGHKKADGTYSSIKNNHRTSMTAWCKDKNCHNDPIVKSIQYRIQNLTAIPINHYEFFQLLKYEKNQYYKVHSDYLDHHVEQIAGPRILTLYLYLSDVEEGGGTKFPKLGDNAIVQPKQGRAILWPSVLNDNPFAIEERTDHEALIVEKGTKYGANVWIHQHDYQFAHETGCT